jgi:hypothetical protein
MHRKKINISTVLARQKLGIKEVDDGIWLVSFMHYDLGYIDLEQRTLQTIDNPFDVGRRNRTMFVAIVRVYDHHTDAADVVQELWKAGVPEHDISVITSDDRVTGAAKGAEIGAAVGGLAGLLTGLGLVAIPGIGPVMATGWLAATAAGAAAGGLAGGALGVVFQAGVSGEEAHTIAECLRRGATLVTARVPDADRTRYEAILDRGAINLHVRAAVYREAGWTSHDPNAAPYTPEEMQRERELYVRTHRL